MINDGNDELDNEIENNNYDYKGYFIENEEADEEPKYFEYGAHFPYNELCNILESIRNKQVKMQKGKQIEKILQPNKKKASTRERNNTRNKQNDKVNSLVKIINIFKSKGHSRNIQKEEQDEITFIHKNNYKNIFSLKKDKQNKSVNNFKSNNSGINYLRIYKNKIHNIKLTNTKLGKLSEKYFLTKQKQKNFLNQRLKLFSKSKPKNKEKNNKHSKDSYEISLQRSFQTQIKQIKKTAKKNIKKNFYPFFSNSKSSLEKVIKSYKKEKIKSSQLVKNKTALKKIQFPNKSEISKKSSELTNHNFSFKSKNKDNIQNHKSPKLNNEKIKNINVNNKPMISVSIDTNNLELFNNNKIKSIKHAYNDKNKNIQTSELNKNKNKKNLDSNKSKENLNILFNTNEKNSRNKLNDFLKNISLINFTDNNKISINTLSKINNTQQNINYRKKKLGKKKEKKNLNINNNNKNILISIPSYSNSNKKKSIDSPLYNNCISNNYYSTEFISKKYPNNKINNTYMNCAILNNSHKLLKLKGIKSYNNPKKDLSNKNLLKNIILKSNKTNKNLKRSITKSEFSPEKINKNINKSPMQKIQYNNLINNNDNNKNNININININNTNSNIIYNNNINNFNNREKSRSRVNTQKSSNFLNPKKNQNLKDNKKYKNNENKNKGSNTQNKIGNKNNMNTKVKLIKIQFPKAKFINICNNDVKNI